MYLSAGNSLMALIFNPVIRRIFCKTIGVIHVAGSSDAAQGLTEYFNPLAAVFQNSYHIRVGHIRLHVAIHLKAVSIYIIDEGGHVALLRQVVQILPAGFSSR